MDAAPKTFRLLPKRCSGEGGRGDGPDGPVLGTYEPRSRFCFRHGLARWSPGASACERSNRRCAGGLCRALSRTPRLIELPACREVALDICRAWVFRDREHSVDKLLECALLWRHRPAARHVKCAIPGARSLSCLSTLPTMASNRPHVVTANVQLHYLPAGIRG